uniref:snRNA-activating protein complex subunit 3 n=1 Tax=Strongyloides stercoralis TaxID=6248 RepID=A0A0K0ERH3_STRER
MSFDKVFLRVNPGSFSLPIVASEFLDHAVQQRKILKEFLDTGEDVVPKDLIYKKFKKKLNIPKNNVITEDYFVNRLIDEKYVAQEEDHPRALVMDKKDIVLFPSSEESNIETSREKRIKNNKRFAMKGLDDVSLSFHRDNTDDELPSIKKRKAAKFIHGNYELEMNERSLTSFLRWKEKWCTNILICQDLMYQDFIDESAVENKRYKLYDKGIQSFLCVMDTSDRDKDFIKFIKLLDGDTKIAGIAASNVESAKKEYFNKYPKIQSYDTVFKDEDVILNKRCIDCFLKKKIYLSNHLNLSEYRKKLKYYNSHMEFLQNTYPEVNTNLPDDFIVTVSFYRPMMNRWKRPNYPKRTVHFIEEKKYQFRGENTVLDIRDTILCSWDVVNTKLASDDFLKLEECFGYIMPSSFIFIHDTFYIDMCRPNAKNLAARVLNFFEKRSHFLTESLKIKSMSDTKIKDLTFRLNCPYVFVHMGGNCEHTFSFNDLRLISPNDYLKLETYPIIRYELIKPRRCNYCKKSTPCFVIMEDNISPKLPALCCQFCFDYLFADKKGILKKDVVAYSYIDKVHHKC